MLRNCNLLMPRQPLSVICCSSIVFSEKFDHCPNKKGFGSQNYNGLRKKIVRKAYFYNHMSKCRIRLSRRGSFSIMEEVVKKEMTKVVAITTCPVSDRH